MIIWQRGRFVVLLGALLACLAACTTSSGVKPSTSPTVTSSAASPTVSATQTGAPATDSPTADPPTTTAAPQPVHVHLHPTRRQLTREGMWWAVDSVVPISAASLANIRGWYRGSPTPVVWGRYITGVYRIAASEITFAQAHGIGVYFIVPDANCSGCGGGDLCGNDVTSAQARADAHDAVVDARRLHLPRGVLLYKDIEEVSGCYGELTATYLIAWFDYVRKTRFVPGLYGNTSEQTYDFPRAYCQATRRDARFKREITLAQDEPEPQLGAPRKTIGPKTAPRFAPYRPSCAPAAKVHIWQYGESTDSGNSTDVDQVVPGTHGILAPDGHVT